MNILIYDIECFSNVFLVCALDTVHQKTYSFEISERQDQRKVLHDWYQHFQEDHILLGFNNHLYDNLMLDKALDLVSTLQASFLHTLKQYNDHLFSLKTRKELWKEAFQIKRLWLKSHNSIDIYRLSSGVSSLKGAALLMNDADIQELPFSPYQAVPFEYMDILKQYCQRDVDITYRLWNKLKQYGVVESRQILCDMGFLSPEGFLKHLSHSDSRLGEEIFGSKTQPNYNRFTMPELAEVAQLTGHKALIAYYQRLSQCKFHVTDDLEVASRDPWHMNNREHLIHIGQQKLTIREAGIHSKQKLAVAINDGDHAIIHIDVSSMYPNALNNFNLLPEKLQEAYRKLIHQKEQAVRERNFFQANATKVGLNAVSGKLKDKYSNLFDGRARMLQVYITQAIVVQILTHLYQELNLHAFNVNTDGIILYTYRSKLDQIGQIISHSSKLWNIQWYVQEYLFVYQTHVNEYFAITQDGKMRTIGSFGRYPYKGFKFFLKKDISAYLRNFLYDWYHSGFCLQPSEWLQVPKPPHWFFMEAGAGSRGKGLKTEIRSGRTKKILRYYFAAHDHEIWFNTTRNTRSRISAEYNICSCDSYQPDWTHVNLPGIDLKAYEKEIQKHIYFIKQAIASGATDGRPIDDADKTSKLKRLQPIPKHVLCDVLQKGKAKEFFQHRYEKLSLCGNTKPTLRQDLNILKRVLLENPKYKRDIYYYILKKLDNTQQLQLFT